jgi:hypothetical protein
MIIVTLINGDHAGESLPAGPSPIARPGAAATRERAAGDRGMP